MEKIIVIAGGSGFLGQLAIEHYLKKGWRVKVLSRKPSEKSTAMLSFIYWDGQNPQLISDTLEGAYLLLNLAGKSVDCRYTEANRMEILRSRLDSTHCLGVALKTCQEPPKLWINASSATIYADAQRPQSENQGEIGEGFSVTVCRQWENTFFSFKDQLPATRFLALRLGIVLSPNDSALVPLKRLAKIGVNQLAHGQQFISWLHWEDYLNILDHSAATESLAGAINATAPEPTRNTDFMQALNKKFRWFPLGFALPGAVLALGARIIKTETELILKSRCVVPEKLLKHGYQFRYANLSSLMASL